MTTHPFDIHDDDARADLEAMLAASRELGPDMDRALVDSYMERQRNAAKSSGTKPAVASASESRPTQPWQLERAIIGCLFIGAYIAALAYSEGDLWWLIFPLMGVFGGWWGWWGHEQHMDRRMAHYDYRMQRHQMREEYRLRRRGYNPDERLDDRGGDGDSRREDLPRGSRHEYD
jgi:hypothetical protein